MAVMKRLIVLLLLLVTAASCHVGRYFIYNFADYKDWKKFPERNISASSHADGFISNYENRIKLESPIDGYDSYEEYHIANKSLSLLIIRNDSILYEWYHPKFDSSSVFTSMSVAKSVVSLLVGIAVDEGKIKSVHDPITKYIPELKNPGLEKITIEHLLNMQSGIDFKESYFNPFGKIAKYYYGKHLLNYIPKLKVAHAPGQGFNYISIDPQLLSIALERATGKKLGDYCQEKLWQTLGMEFDASWSIDSKRGDTEKGFCGLNARSRDYAKIGRLMLNMGNYNGKQIVSEDWMKHCYDGAENYGGYAYQWWNFQSSDRDIMAQGILGQYVYVNPKKNVIIVRTGKKWGKEINWWRFFRDLSSDL